MKENLVSQENYHICRFNKQKYFCIKKAIISTLQMFSLSLTNYLHCCLFCESLNLPHKCHLILQSLYVFVVLSRGLLCHPDSPERRRRRVYMHFQMGTPSSMYSVNEFESMLSIFLSPSSSFCRCPGAGGCFAGLFGLWPYLISVNSPSVQLKSLSEFSSYGHHVIFNFDL